MSRRSEAVAFALAAVLFFALMGYGTQRVAEHFSIVSVVGFRTLIGSVVLAIYVAADVFFTPAGDRVTYFRAWSPLFTSISYVGWTLLFALTAALYGYAVAGTRYQTVLLIAALMPLLVISLEFATGRKAFEHTFWPPLTLLVLSATIPHLWLLPLPTEPKFNVAVICSIVAVICHALWIFFGPPIRANTSPATEPPRNLCMFLLAGFALLVIANTDASQTVEILVRREEVPTELLRFSATETRARWLIAAGIFAAISVLSFNFAAEREAPSRLVPYFYMLPVWGLMLTAISDPQNPDYTFWTWVVWFICALGSIAGTVWFIRVSR
jgi:hypothetical protein